VTTSVPCGAWPETATVCGEAGSFDSIVIVAVFAPAPLGFGCLRRG
jgi:hypothetical protein